MQTNPPGTNAERPEHIFEQTEASLRAAQERAIDMATRLGQQIELVHALLGPVTNIGNASTTNPEAAAIYTSALNVMAAFRNGADQINQSLEPVAYQVRTMSASGFSLAGTVATTAAAVIHQPISLPQNLLTDSSSWGPTYIERFARIDPELGKLYEAVKEARYGTSAAPERTAAPLLRQVYDYLFSILAPDDLVRQSPFWTPQNKKNPDDVWRSERLEYALAKYIKYPTSAQMLRAVAAHIRTVHSSLSDITHAKRSIDVEQARSALTEMQGFLETWVTAMEE